MNENLAGENFQKLVNLMNLLREKCPWDKKQTIHSLQKYTIEELYELVDAINNNNFDELKGELGDVLFHTLFYSRIASEENHFTITDVLDNVYKKLVRRHPHVFGEISVKDEHEVAKNWEQIKLKEGNKSILGGVPKSLPAIIKAFRVQEKTAQVGFDFNSAQAAYEKVNEEKQELEQVMKQGTTEQIELEFGDLMFSLINYARKKGIDPEAALEKTNQKFINRFLYVENKVMSTEQKWSNLNLEELDIYWNEAKNLEDF